MAVLGASVFAFAPPLEASASTATWLQRLNGWRAISNLPALSENSTWDAGDAAHSLYMVKNQVITHYEDSTLPYYTAAGDQAARNGNIEVSSMTSTQDWQAIDWWMAAPFHAMGMMDPRLTSTGFGAYREVRSGWQTGFALDVLRGNSFTGGTYPVYFPGNGSNEPLTTYSGGEFPDPLQACSGYAVPTGLPVFIQVGGNVHTAVTASAFTGNGSPLQYCVIDSNNAAVGSNLVARGGVIVIPRQPLQAGVHYTVALTVNGVPYTWSFGVSSSSSMAPAAPTITGAVAGDASATVNWTPPLDNGGTAITSYTVSAYTSAGLVSSTTVAGTSTSATYTGLTNGTTYWFTVAAVNSIGTGPAATSYSVTPAPVTPPPARMTASSMLQYRLSNSDGFTWQDMDENNLSLSFTPAAASMAVISANADLWTANAGYNQDLGIWLDGAIVAWKESGGSAGTFSPNAAEVQAVVPVAGGTTYSVKLDWKTNKPAMGASIYAGAGPLSSQFSPGRLSVTLLPVSQVATAVSTSQSSLAGSDGSTWQSLNLTAPLAPTAAGTAVVTANADLWTASAGVNQDLGIFASVDGGADQLLGWKESGGSAGTFSPNAAFVQSTLPVAPGHSYAFTLKWKANKNAPGATIFAGAGPLTGSFSPTRLTAFVEPAAGMATAVSESQYRLSGSDGVTWQPLDTTGLAFNFTPAATGAFLGSGNADLWTANAGVNQDIGIMVSGGSFGAGTLVAWKESGGYGGTFSPNAAYVETVINLQASTTYRLWLVWKTNTPEGGAAIFAGAGPLSGSSAYSPTRVTLIPS